MKDRSKDKMTDRFPLEAASKCKINCGKGSNRVIIGANVGHN
jgi:hypothetical protein